MMLVRDGNPWMVLVQWPGDSQVFAHQSVGLAGTRRGCDVQVCECAFRRAIYPLFRGAQLVGDRLFPAKVVCAPTERQDKRIGEI